MTDPFKRYGFDNAWWASDLDCLRSMHTRAEVTRHARQRARVRLARDLRGEIDAALEEMELDELDQPNHQLPADR